MRILFAILCFFFEIQLAVAGDGGFSLSKLRVIYNEKDNYQTIKVVNSADKLKFLAQSWVDDGRGMKNSFIVTPPLYLQGGGETMLKIIKQPTAVFPSDRESLLWLNVKAIPSVDESEVKNKSSIQLAYVLRVKLFYRPSSISVSPSDTFKNLKVEKKNDEVYLNNPTPFFVTLASLKYNDRKISDGGIVISPFSEKRIDVAGDVVKGKLKGQVVNDSGALVTLNLN